MADPLYLDALDRLLAAATIPPWRTLTDGDGNVVNERQAAEVSPAEQVTIVLSGDDLAMSAGDDGRRQVVIRATYDGSLGDALPIVGVLEFTVRNVPGVA